MSAIGLAAVVLPAAGGLRARRARRRRRADARRRDDEPRIRRASRRPWAEAENDGAGLGSER